MIQPSLFATRTDAEWSPERVHGDSGPRFRRRDTLLCSWCHGPRERKSRGDRRARFCSDRCRSEAFRARGEWRKYRHQESRRRMAMDTARRNNRWQVVIARWGALKAFAARESGSGTISHVRLWLGKRGIDLEWHKPWTGSVFSCDWFTQTGRMIPAFHAGSNARKVAEWRITDEGWEALRSK